MNIRAGNKFTRQRKKNVKKTRKISLQHRIRSLSIIGIALASILQIRLSLPGPTKEFSTADNPIAKATSVWTRLLTFTYLPVFNFKLLLYPSTMSFDWGMDAIPRLTSLFDSRNLLSLIFYTVLAKAIWINVNILRARLPAILENQRRRPRPMRKRKQIYHQAANVNAKSAECVCTVCKQGLNVRHTSSCRASNNNNVPSPSVKCGCPAIRHPSPPPTSINASPLATSSPSFTSSTARIARDYKRTNIKHTSVSSSCNSDAVAAASSPASAQPSASAALLLSIALLALPFLPAANLFFYVGFVVAERILYLPSVGYCLLIGLGVGKLMDPNHGPLRSQTKRYAMLCCISIVLIAYSLKTVQRNGDWHDEESLFRSAINVNPPKGNYNKQN